MAENNTVSRGTTIGFSTLAAAGGAILAMIVTRSLDQPADLQSLEGLVNSNAVTINATSVALGVVAVKQDDVRERLTVVETSVERAGEDRFRGKEARLSDRLYTYRLNELSEAVKRLEATCYIGGSIVNRPSGTAR